MRVRVFAPELNTEIEMWSGKFYIGDPMGDIFGVYSLQSLLLAMKTLPDYLRGSNLYSRSELGI